MAEGNHRFERREGQKARRDIAGDSSKPAAPFRLPTPASRLSLAQQSIHKFLCRKWLEVVDRFTDADETYRNLVRSRNGGDHTALRGAIELGQHEAGDAQRIVKGLH